MYFESRSQAGAKLADQVLEKYRYENCAVVALGDGGIIDKRLLKDRTVILASDGLGDNLSPLDVALSFLKSVRIDKLVIAVPFCGIAAVDRLHMTVDEMHILDVKENFMGTNHYYDDNTLPSKEETVKKINQVILNWQ